MAHIASLGLLFLSARAQSLPEKPVHIPDPQLKAAIEKTLEIANPTARHMLKLTELNADNAGITDLSGLEHAKKLVAEMRNQR